jgi:predicted Zn-dependent protease/uncharacterized protein involved in exopolysaccharide biosynthesis
MHPSQPFSLRTESNWFEAYRVSDFVLASARRWKLAVLTSLLGLGAALGFCWLYPDTYISYAQLLFLPPQVSEKFVASNVTLHAEQRVAALTQMIGNHATAGKMIQEFGLYPRLRRWWPVADLVPAFRSDLSIRVIGSIQAEGRAVPTVEISFRYSDPAVAQKVVQRVLETIYEENQRMRSNQTFRTTDFLQRQTREVHEQLKEAEQRLEDLRLADPAQRFQATALATEKLHEVHRRLYATQFDLRRAINDRDLKRFQLQSLQERAKDPAGEATPALDTSWAGQTWRLRLAEARARAEEARRRYRVGFPDREAAEREVERIQAELKHVEENDKRQNEMQIRQRLFDEVERAQADLDGLTRNIAALQKEEASLLEQEKEAVAAAMPNERQAFLNLAAIRDHELLKKRFEEMLKKQRDSEVATEMERVGQGETIDLIEPPVLPSRARMPVRWMKLAAGLCAGLFAGLMIPIALLLQRPRIVSSHRLEMLLGTPLLGELPAAQVRMLSIPGLRNIRTVRLTVTNHWLLAVVLMAALAGCAKESAASLIARAAAAGRAGKRAEAALLYRRAIQADPRSGEAYRQLAELAAQENEPAAAREALIRAVELIPGEPSLRVNLAEVTYRLFFADAGRPDTLLREVEVLSGQLMTQWPELADGYRLAAQALLETRRIRDAVQTLETGLRHIPGDPSLATQLASALYQDGDRKAAAARLQTLIDSGTDYPPAYDLYYLQLMEVRQYPEAEGVLRVKWAKLASIESGLQFAAHLLASGRSEPAQAILNELATRHAKDPLAPLQIAEFWFNRADPQRARTWLERGRREHPEAAPRYAGRQIELLLSENRRDSARQLLAAEMAANPGNPLLEAYREAIEIDRPGDDAARQAKVRLEAILNRMPDSPFVRYHLGRAYLRNGDVTKAGQQFERCVTLDHNYAMGWLALADSHLRQGKYSRAADESKLLVTRGVTLAPVYLINAQAELRRNRPADAERALDTMLQLAPDHPEGRLLMVQAKLALGKREDARKRMKQLLEREPDQPETLASAARLEAALGSPTTAFDRLSRMLARQPDNPPLRIALAQISAGLGRFDVTLEQYRKLEAGQPAALEYALGVANSLALLKRTAEAGEQYKKVQKMSGTDARPWLNYAVLMAEAGDWKRASEGYREALRRDPRNPLALNNLADLLTRNNGDLTEALTLAEQAGRLMPDAPEVIDTLAHAYLRKGMTGNAVASYRKLMERLPGPERARIGARIERIERGDLSGALSEAAAAGLRM